jgi:hypothetical protein
MSNPKVASNPPPILTAPSMHGHGLFVGTVTGVSPIEICLSEGGIQRAVVAASLSYGLCVGDIVLAVQLESQCWVLDVLHLVDDPHRRFQVQGASSIRLRADHIELNAGTLQATAAGAVFRMGIVRFRATSVLAVCHKIHTWTRNWFLRAQVVATRAHQRISRVDAADVLRATELNVQLSGAHNVTAQESHVVARDNASLSGRKVLLG